MTPTDPGTRPRRKRLTREESREQTRTLLLEAATELFMEKGVNGTSVEQIAERAGFTRGAFYSNYDDKHAVVIELLKRRQTAPSIDLENFREGLTAWHKRREENLAGWFTLRGEMVLYALRNPDVRHLLADRERDVWSTLAAGIAAEARDADSELSAPAELLGLILHALDDGLFIQRLLYPQDVTQEMVIDAVDILLRSWREPSGVKGKWVSPTEGPARQARTGRGDTDTSPAHKTIPSSETPKRVVKPAPRSTR
ncbi:TetR/AcrR family transcriptional regulator [Sphingopyxis kveilinensis]|uniref:TetR/AcrR family transcriptional regulator n=1 Tax=Sphingopyxis kveilinensis TaxID=3114367 RepID=UPI0030D32594